MTILSTALVDFEDKEVRAVLTIGNLASLTGEFTNDVAVYIGPAIESKESIAKNGLKLSCKAANEIGYTIDISNYRR